MGKATVTWVQRLQFVGTDSTRHSVVISAPDEANGVGMKPSELLLVSLGACTAFDVVNILQKKRKTLHHLHVEVEGEQQDSAPWPFTRIHVHYVIWRRRSISRTRSIARCRPLCGPPSS